MLHNQSIHIFNPQLPQVYSPNAIIDEHSQQKPDINQTKWQQFHDASTGHDYWYDADANRSTWTQPNTLRQSVSDINDCFRMDAACVESEDDESDEYDQDTSSEEENDENNSDSDDLPNLLHYSSDKYEPQKNDDESTKQQVTIDARQANGDNDNGLWNIAASQGDNYVFAIYAQHYFRAKNKKNLIQFTAYNKFKPSLHKMNSKLNKQSKQIWKNINSYMLLRKSSKSDSGHVDKLLNWALNSPQILRDELFCQIVKQTNCNPRIESTIKGMQLMCLCCCTFPPSAQLAPFLATYLLNNTKDMAESAECALFALKALDSIMISGPRLSPLSHLEIQSIEQREAIPLKLYYLDGSFHSLLVSSQTQTRHVLEEMSKVLHLNFAQSYGIFCIEQEKQRLLEENERIMDVYSASKVQKEIQFIFKCKIQSSKQRHKYSYNDWKQSYFTLNYNVIHGLFPLQEQDYYHLAAIQLQAIYGTKDKYFYRPGLLVSCLDEFVPNTMIMKDNKAKIEGNILSKLIIYQSLNEKNSLKKYLAYLSTCSSSYCYYDCSFFRCVQQSNNDNASSNNLLVGISEREILFLNPATLAITNRYKLHEIETFGFKSSAFLFVVGSLMKQKRIYLSTKRGKEMNDCLAQHIEINASTN